ncbi:MAG: hypothetical protein TREMPRED_000107 [Tremellales sp. Tagirdzhanova-0007]|nr:MAG: hypothetical protein TREMPRED_000107 [Tremellales sp. Tagirdzhanova-0007]
MPSQAPFNSDVTIANNRSFDHGHADLERGDVQPSSAEREKKPEKPDLVVWDGPDDPQNPQNWPRSKKIRVTILYGMTTMCATFASSIFASASPFIAKDYGLSTEVTILGLSLFLLGFGFGPVLWAPLSEVYGRKTAILVPMFVFICLSAGTATAENAQTIFVTRFFGGVMASSPVTIVGGGIADIFNQRERGSMIVIYSLCIVGGPTIAPVIGSAMSESYLTWRWTEYIVVILGSVVLATNMLFLPETSAAVILTAKARSLRLKTGNWALHSQHEEVDRTIMTFLRTTLFLPLKMLGQEPMLLLIALYNAFAYGILYLLFAAIPIIYGETRGWGSVSASLPNLATLVGTLLAAGLNFVYASHFFKRYMDTHGGRAPPERRLPPMMVGSIAFPIGFFIIGWTSNPSIHWFPSLIGLVLVGMSFLLIFQAGINYLIDAYTRVSASAIAANTFCRSLLGAAFPLIAQPLFHNLGVNWACTLLGCIGILLGITPFLFFRFGARHVWSCNPPW